MAGIVLGSHLQPPVGWCLLVLAVMVGTTALMGRWRQSQTVAIMLCMVVLGVLVVSMDDGRWMRDDGRGMREEGRGMRDDGRGTLVGQRVERTRQYFLNQRSRLLQRLESAGLTTDAYAVVAAMALGDKSALTHDLKDTYSRTGASHVLALSGLHLGIIYTLLSMLVVGRRWQTVTQVIMIISIWAFVFLVGMPTSVVRAAVMLTVYALLALGHRRRMSVNTLAFTAIAMLLVSPRALFDVGFQMSFMAVFCILLFVPLFLRPVSARYLMTHRLARWLLSMVAVSVAAQIGVAPLIAYYFGRFSCYFLLTNFIVIPAATAILYLTLATLLLPPLGIVLSWVVTGLNATLLYIAAMPGATIDGLHPSVGLTVSLYGVILATYYLLSLTIQQADD
jgi:competence protein ComEC